MDTKCYALIKKMVSHFVLGLMLVLSAPLSGFTQAPSNNNCTNAISIPIANGGFGLGTFNSANVDISAATVEGLETFDNSINMAGQTLKSVWFKFSIPTTRSVQVTLTQPPGNAIAAGDVGFVVYQTNTCLPGTAQRYKSFSPNTTFGSTLFNCVQSGDYLIQISSKSSANGLVGIQLVVDNPMTSLYDHPAQAYDFGKLTNNISHVDFHVECQSLEDATEVCPVLSNFNQYTKSTWHTFTTPAYMDFLGVFIGSANPDCLLANGSAVFGYNLYQGDVKVTPYNTLPVVDVCDSFQITGPNADKKIYQCGQLKPNTTYSIQLFYNQDFNDNVRLTLDFDGVAPTRAPQPLLAGIPASNQFGLVNPTPAGLVKTDTDYLACNSRHIVSSCGPAQPLTPIYSPNNPGFGYNMSTFFTFTLASESNVSFNALVQTPNLVAGPPPLLVRVFNQGVSNTCSSLDPKNIIGQYIQAGSLTCLPAGN